MSVKQKLCDAIVIVKSERGYTYDNLVSVCNKGVAKSQFIKILKYGGEGVSITTLEYVLHCLGLRVEISVLEDLKPISITTLSNKK